MTDFVRAAYEVARKEFMQHLRTKRLLIITGFLVLFLGLFMFVFGPEIVRDISFTETSRQHIVLSFYFAAGLVGGLQFTQLLALVLTLDAVCSEWSNRTIFLLLSKPVPRSAFVTGKFLGNLFTIAVTLVPLFLLTYLLMIPAYSGSPSGKEFLGFLGMLGFILLGAAAFASFSLFVSTLTKSTLMSALIVMAMWLIGFPLLGNIGTFTSFDDPGVELDDWPADWSRYLNPSSMMQAGAKLLVTSEADQDLLDFIDYGAIFSFSAQRLWLAGVGLGAFTVVFFLGSLLVVQFRNFE